MDSKKQLGSAKPAPSFAWALSPLAILIVPLFAMQLTDSVNWGPGDFVVASTLLVAVGLGSVLIARQRARISPQVVLGILIIALALLAWVELAVGIL